MHRICIAMALVACLAFVSSIRAQTTAPAGEKLASKDTKFIDAAAAGGLEEVTLGKLAADKATSDDVKKFGQMMADDHSKANDELKALASSKGVDLTKTLDKAQTKAQKDSDKLAKETGDAFDRAYMSLMVKDHEKDVKEFEEASKTAKDEDLKAWAAKTLPTLQHHLDMAKEVQGKIKK